MCGLRAQPLDAQNNREGRRRLLQELGDQKIPFLGPTDQGYQQLWDSSYAGLVLRRSCSVPVELHSHVQAAFLTLRKKGCLLRDLVRVRDRDVFTAVSRALLGEPGHTYRYLDTRLFTKPLGLGDNEKPVAQLKHSLSDYHIEDKENQEDRCSQPSSPCLCTGPVKFNVTLLNFMDPAAMSHIKEEPYCGMGKMAVGWHHDENLVTHSPVAVYSYSCYMAPGEASSDPSISERSYWRIGLKVAWDIHTPGLMLPLESGDCYYMRDDLNSTHQHCVLAGDTARFSSTHRVAECSKGTLTYIQSRCQEALSNLRTDPETGSHSLLALLPTTLQLCEEIHNEVEFEWLRQYWFQGRRYTRFCRWWSRPMEQLESDWRLLETMEEDGRAGDNRREMAETLLSALTDRHQQRQTWRDRCHSTLAQTLPPEEAPVDRPFWGVDDPRMPLPFDLAEIISRVESKPQKCLP
uniref:Alpha-ketoglutarate-dependent dioxygenase FTO n=1 Tax=Neogobius melanostomus TaxID=47308 RepID=A0A8C6T2B1_9GOBI